MSRSELLTDLLVLVGLVGLGWGLRMIYEPLAFIVLGLLVLAAGLRRAA